MVPTPADDPALLSIVRCQQARASTEFWKWMLQQSLVNIGLSHAGWVVAEGSTT